MEVGEAVVGRERLDLPRVLGVVMRVEVSLQLLGLLETVFLDLSIQAVSLLFGHAAKLHSCTSKGDKESVNNQGMN